MENYFKRRAAELDLSAEDVSFRLAKLDIQITSQTVRNWFVGTVPNLSLADPLADVFKTDRKTILEVMHALAEGRQKRSATAELYQSRADASSTESEDCPAPGQKPVGA
jgi:hypothetical protein